MLHLDQHLDSANTDPTDLLKYKVIVSSYAFVVAEYKRITAFKEHLDQYQKGTNATAPQRPFVSLLSGIWTMAGVHGIGRFLVLDDSHCINNVKSTRYLAIKMLRERFHSCLMLTATPIDDVWWDLLGPFSLLRGHPFTSVLRMRDTFTNAANVPPKDRSECNPEGKWLERLTQFMHAFMLHRPLGLIDGTSPAVHP